MTDHHDDDDVLDIDEAIGGGDDGDHHDDMPDGFHASDPETGLPIAGDDHDENEEEEPDTF